MNNTTAALYCGGPLYFGGTAVINDLKASGFTEVVAWTLHVSADGNLVFNDTLLVKDGEYQAGSNKDWPMQLAELKSGTTSVKRLLFSVGSAGVSDFSHIKSLIAEQGTGPDSALYKNFQALRNAISAIDAIDMDDEDTYDRKSMVQFCTMLAKLGFEVTFCPSFPSTQDFWLNCLSDLTPKLAERGPVTAFNLQCYAGGAPNNPLDWVKAIEEKMGPNFDAHGLVIPGLWCRHNEQNSTDCSYGMCPDEIQTHMANWNNDPGGSTGVGGGFIWLYDDIEKCKSSKACNGTNIGSAAYAKAVLEAFHHWGKVDNVAEYKDANWDNFIKTVPNTTVEAAKELADADDDIHFFFYCRQPVILNSRQFNAGDAVFFSGKPWFGSAPQCDSYQKMVWGWKEKSDVAEFKGAPWDNMVRKVGNVSVDEAKRIADVDPLITFFFYCNQPVVLEPHGAFAAREAVFFKGEPWYGSAPQCNAYERAEVPVWDG